MWWIYIQAFTVVLKYHKYAGRPFTLSTNTISIKIIFYIVKIDKFTFKHLFNTKYTKSNEAHIIPINLLLVVIIFVYKNFLCAIKTFCDYYLQGLTPNVVFFFLVWLRRLLRSARPNFGSLSSSTWLLIRLRPWRFRQRSIVALLILYVHVHQRRRVESFRPLQGNVRTLFDVRFLQLKSSKSYLNVSISPLRQTPKCQTIKIWWHIWSRVSLFFVTEFHFLKLNYKVYNFKSRHKS